MNGIMHLIIALCFVLGMVAIDLDHFNSQCGVKNMWKGFLGQDDFQR